MYLSPSEQKKNEGVFLISGYTLESICDSESLENW